MLSPAEIASLIAVLDIRERAMMMLGGSTGLRRSELLALTWADIDLELMQVNVHRSVCGITSETPRLKRAANRFHCTLPFVKSLGVWRKESPYAGEIDFLFPSVRLKGKKPLSPDTLLKKIIRPALKRAGIEGKAIGWHSFRHSLATNLRSAGVDLKTAQELLRHGTHNHARRVHASDLRDQARGQQKGDGNSVRGGKEGAFSILASTLKGGS